MGKRASLEENPLIKFCDLTAKERRELVFIPESLTEEIFPEGIEGFDPAEKVRDRSRRLRKAAGKKIHRVTSKATPDTETESESSDQEEDMGNFRLHNT